MVEEEVANRLAATLAARGIVAQENEQSLRIVPLYDLERSPTKLTTLKESFKSTAERETFLKIANDATARLTAERNISNSATVIPNFEKECFVITL
jgi:hypothetical protein